MFSSFPFDAPSSLGYKREPSPVGNVHSPANTCWGCGPCYFMETVMSDKPLKLVTCSNPDCAAKVFIPGDLPPLATEPCKRCGHPIMMPMQLRQFELRSKIASGGQGKVYRAF